VEGPHQKHLVLILAREFASNLASPTIIFDETGRLVFLNEAAEALVGHPLADVGEIPYEEWVSRFSPRSPDGEEPLPLEDRAPGIALYEHRPAHERIEITSADGVARTISVTSIPLYAHADEFVGVVTVWWRD
jgi:PAS domain-containing protein